jgi:GDPmannose 4,6-dehydratase
MSFNNLDIDIKFEGDGINEVGYDPSGRIIVEIDEKYFRPTEVDTLLGDYSKAKSILGWEPEYSVEMLCKEMVTSDYNYFANKISEESIYRKVFG